MLSVAIITVTHESAHVIDAFVDGIERLLRAQVAPLRLIVVDNASRDDTVARLRRRGVEPICADDNRGWGAGNNLGVAQADGAELLLFLNPDIVVPPPALLKMISLMDTGAVGAVTPRIRAGGRLRPGAGAGHDLASALLGAFGLRRARSWWLNRQLETDADVVLHGAYPEGGCLLVRRAAFAAAGPFDERFFVFFDDVDFGRSLRRAGFGALMAGSAIVDELPGKGSRAAPGRDADEERIARFLLYLQGELRYFDKWAGPRIGRGIAHLRRDIDLRLHERRWRRRYGIGGLRARALPVIDAFLAERRK